MSFESPSPIYSFEAGESLTGDQFRAVKLNSSGKIVGCGAGESGIGVLQDKPASGEVGCVWMAGVTKVVYGDTVVAGDNLTPDASGRFVPANGNDVVWGVAFESGAVNTLGTMGMVARTSLGTSAGVEASILSIPIKLATITAGDVATGITPGFAGKITKVQFLVTTAVTTAAKAATLNLEIGTTNLTGGAVALTSANCTPLGAVVAGTAVTANNEFTDTDTISVEGSSVTAFSEGEGVLLITVERV